MMVTLISVRKRLHHAATDLGQEMASEVTLAIEELGGAASTQLGHAMCLAVSSFNTGRGRRQ